MNWLTSTECVVCMGCAQAHVCARSGKSWRKIKGRLKVNGVKKKQPSLGSFVQRRLEFAIILLGTCTINY